MRTPTRRAAIIGAAFAFGFLGSALPAVAHNGVGAAFKGRAGPYTVYAYDGYVLPHNELQYRLILLDGRSGDPAEDVHVLITASKPGTAHVTTAANVYNNIVFYTLPDPYPVNWLIDLRLDGTLGHGEVRFHMHGYTGYAAPTASSAASPITTTAGAFPTATVVAALSVGAVIASGGILLWRRRRPMCG